MKYIINTIMMLLVFVGYSQTSKKKGNTHIITFPNGDEAITIIEKSNTNVLKLTSNESYNKFETLELSNHEAIHTLSLKRNINIVDKTEGKESGLTMNQKGQRSTVSSKEPVIDPEQDS